jgi:hypothetical protein
LPKRHNGLDSPTVYVLVTDNKFDFYNITEIADKKYRIVDRALERIIVKRVFTIHQLAHFLIIELENEIAKKYKSKLLVITGDFFLSDPQYKEYITTKVDVLFLSNNLITIRLDIVHS